MKAVILGAGASKSYSDSKTGVRMPVASDFFNTYLKLDISENQEVLIGGILNYLKKFRGKEYLDFLNFNEDIEVLHSEIEAKLIEAFSKSDKLFSSDGNRDKFQNNVIYYSAYNQLIFFIYKCN